MQWLSSSSHENQEDIEAETIPISSSTEEVEIVEVVESQLQQAQSKIKLLESQLQDQERTIESQTEQLKQAENFSALLLTHRILEPGLPLNGTQLSPAMRVLGSPTTLTELEANYRELLKREHPDVSPFALSEAIARFSYLRSLYRITREHWQELKPTAPITLQELERRMNARVPFVPESFW
ncbi:DnaJ domain protein (fragment) [Hyella patelloides LEGE 07179]|uniref:DnaJ domain protein n=1 Tax=Hyella patelloides LEGE 07179 TaxID=945734 RepID=A0A563VXE1_9CYAN